MVRVREAIWRASTKLPVPRWLSFTPPVRLIEKILTRDYLLQRRATAYVPPRAHRVLDVGCGGAVYMTSLPQEMYKIGLDVQPIRLETAQHYCNKVVLRDILEEGLSDISADVVLCFEVIEHLPKSLGKRLLQELSRFPLVILTTPRTFFNINRDGYEKHHSLWTAEDLAPHGYALLEEISSPPSNIYRRVNEAP